MDITMFSQFLKSPLTTGAVCASSQSLAKELIAGTRIECARSVVELGPGTGAVTSCILSSMQQKTHFFAVELNPDVLLEFQKKFPEIKVYNDSAANLRQLVREEGIVSADVIISGLPWAIFSESVQKDILSAVYDTLAADGSFTTFAYVQGLLLPRGRAFRKQLNHYFSKVVCSNIIWRNFPPAFVYHCHK